MAEDSNQKQPTGAGADRRRQRRRGLLRWLGRADDVSDLYQHLSSFFASKAGVATVSVGIGAAAVGGAAGLYPEVLRSWLLRGDVTVETERWGEVAVVYPIEGRDAAGRRARFDVALLQKQFTWLWGSDQALAKQSRALTTAEIDELFKGELGRGLARSPEVIAVGVASEEGAQSRESTRAERRSETAAHWLGRVLPPSTKVLLLNLGQFRSSCAVATGEDSSWQRPFMAIGVREQEPGTAIDEALADALKGKTNMPSPECYSEFKLSEQG
jgi:hypothetical protein